MPNPPLAVWIPILMNVVALLQCVLAATSFAEATVVKKNAKVAKELGLRPVRLHAFRARQNFR